MQSASLGPPEIAGADHAANKVDEDLKTTEQQQQLASNKDKELSGNME